MTHEERMDALEAGRILQSAVFRRVFDTLDARYVQAWRTSTDSVKREDWWYRQRALADMKKELFEALQCAAVREKGKDEVLNTAVEAVKENRYGRKS